MNWRFFSVAVSLFTVIIVFVFAVAFLFTSLMADSLYGAKRQLFIFILFAYGAYRTYRLYHLLKTNNDENR